MRHVLAAGSLHDGGGLFTLAWAAVTISLGLALVFNYRGMADRMYDRMLRRGRGSMSPASWRRYGGIFLAAGVVALIFAVGRFAQGGY